MIGLKLAGVEAALMPAIKLCKAGLRGGERLSGLITSTLLKGLEGRAGVDVSKTSLPKEIGLAGGEILPGLALSVFG